MDNEQENHENFVRFVKEEQLKGSLSAVLAELTRLYIAHEENEVPNTENERIEAIMARAQNLLNRLVA